LRRLPQRWRSCQQVLPALSSHTYSPILPFGFICFHCSVCNPFTEWKQSPWAFHQPNRMDEPSASRYPFSTCAGPEQPPGQQPKLSARGPGVVDGSLQRHRHAISMTEVAGFARQRIRRLKAWSAPFVLMIQLSNFSRMEYACFASGDLGGLCSPRCVGLRCIVTT
ncbi:MAG: hypothetical protein V7606_2379, partial [Burkholderiales bacterium]